MVPGVYAYYQPLLMPATVLCGSVWGGLGYFTTVFIILGIHPFIDNFAPKLKLSNSTLPLTPFKQRNWKSDLPILLFIPLEVFAFIWALHHYTHTLLTPSERMGLILSTGFITGSFGFTLAHECIHRKSALFRGLGLFLLSLVSYQHYRIFHVNWHHRFVGTELDPGTARKGESLYAFWSRAIPLNLYLSWRVETRRLKSKGLSAINFQNLLIQFALIQLSLLWILSFSFGLAGLFFFLSQSIVAILLLETIHYIEHYGLTRAKLPGEKIEPIAAVHTWDSRHLFTNWHLYNLGLHADHHLDPTRSYERLRPREGSHLLPYGYSSMILIALFPTLWFRMMDPRISMASNLAPKLKTGEPHETHHLRHWTHWLGTKRIRNFLRGV